MDLSAGHLLEIRVRTDRVFDALHLQPLLLRLPFGSRDAASTIKGICGKVRKNRSLARALKSEEALPHALASAPAESHRFAESEEAEQSVNELEAFLSDQRSEGFVFILAEVPGGREAGYSDADSPEAQYCPVAGGVVEVYDACERTVRAVWCRRSIPPELSLIVSRALLLRLLAHAFASVPNSPPNRLSSEELAARGSHTGGMSVLACCKASTMALFPLEALEYCQSELRMTRHWETELDGGQHIDQAATLCRCRVLQAEKGAWEFSGISLSRFVSYWRNHGKGSVPHPSPFFATFFRRASDTPHGAKDRSVKGGLSASRRAFANPTTINKNNAAKRGRRSATRVRGGKTPRVPQSQS